MKIKDFEITIIKSLDSGTFTAFPKNKKLSGLIVQVNDINEIPKELTKSFEAMITYSFEQKNYKISEFKPTPKD